MPSKDKSTFFWLNATQFFGALNDNLFKFFIILFLIGTLGKENTDIITVIAGLVFVLPFLLFSHAAGVLADRISKNRIIVLTKFLEVIIMALGFLAFLSASPLALYSVIFLMSVQSAFFGPSKYGIIPELVSREALSRANSFLVSLSFLAIILGTAAAPAVSYMIGSHYAWAGVLCVLIAGIGLFCSGNIQQTPAAGAKKPFTPFFIKEIWKTTLHIYRTDTYLFVTVIGSAYFMLIGAYVQMNLIDYGINVLNLTKESSTFLFLLAAFGIGLGSFIAGKLSGRNIEFGIVPVGALGITLTCFFLHILPPNALFFVSISIFALGMSAGLFIVPLQSFIQFRSPAKTRGEILACSNFLGFVGVLIASGLILLFSRVFKVNPAQGFFIIGLLNLVLTVATLWILPDFFLRFIMLVITHIFYKLKIKGIENIPVDGPALLISNHVSWVDAFLLMATTQRRLRFVMDRKIYSQKWLSPLFRLMGIIPVAVTDSPKKMQASLIKARAALDEGYLLCIFAEGRITRSGHISKFRKGFEKILEGTSHPAIPVYIGGAWGSIFSYYFGKTFSRLPYMIPYPVTILFGQALPSESSALEVRLAVMELAGDFFELLKPGRRSLSSLFVSTARENWSSKAVGDSTGKSLNYGQALTGALALSSKLAPMISDQKNVGILLPSSVAGMLSNMAVMLLGKVPVNINFTASEEAILSAIRQCEIKNIITSKLFLKRLKNFPALENMIYLENISRTISKKEKITAFLKARFFPRRLLDKNPRSCGDKTATIIFSSGSTAEPKGIILTHHNIISNIESIRMILKVGNKDNILGALPFFHSFGFTGTLWFPLISGFSAFYHPSPLESSKIVSLIKENQSTILLTTPTFLMAYMRKAQKEDFGSLRYVIVGAEKLATRLSQAFTEKYAVSILEGYGATELSPFASVNIPDVHIDNVRHVGTKEGSVGHPLPGITVKIVDPESGTLLPLGKTGLLMVKGPNVMKGYLNQPEKTAEVLKDGWYNTGDIARMDADGFIIITDRLSRFSKIGGEMVPHIAVEEAYLKKLDAEKQVVAVTAVPDEKKGEKLIVLYLEEAGTAEELHKIITESDIPNLWKPRKENYFLIPEMPVLGSGKLNLKTLKKIAGDKC